MYLLFTIKEKKENLLLLIKKNYVMVKKEKSNTKLTL
jgi:hypothetical protein